jgi:hypothetical protein
VINEQQMLFALTVIKDCIVNKCKWNAKVQNTSLSLSASVNTFLNQPFSAVPHGSSEV